MRQPKFGNSRGGQADNPMLSALFLALQSGMERHVGVWCNRELGRAGGYRTGDESY
jgi:hypothetical protein